MLKHLSSRRKKCLGDDKGVNAIVVICLQCELTNLHLKINKFNLVFKVYYFPVISTRSFQNVSWK